MTSAVVDTDVVSYVFKNHPFFGSCYDPELAGRRIESADAWIAATTLLHDAPLLTNNRNDYLGAVGLTLISHAQ